MRTSVVSSMSRSFSRISRSTSTECRSLQSSLARRASKRNDGPDSAGISPGSAMFAPPGESVAAIAGARCGDARSRSPMGSTRVRVARAPTSFGPSPVTGAPRKWAEVGIPPDSRWCK